MPLLERNEVISLGLSPQDIPHKSSGGAAGHVEEITESSILAAPPRLRGSNKLRASPGSPSHTDASNSKRERRQSLDRRLKNSPSVGTPTSASASVLSETPTLSTPDAETGREIALEVCIEVPSERELKMLRNYVRYPAEEVEEGSGKREYGYRESKLALETAESMQMDQDGEDIAVLSGVIRSPSLAGSERHLAGGL